MSYRYTYVDLGKDRKEVVADLRTSAQTAPYSPPQLSSNQSDVVTISRPFSASQMVVTEPVQFVPVLEMDGEIFTTEPISIESPRAPPVSSDDGILTLFAILADREDCPEDVRFLVMRHINGDAAEIVRATLMDGSEEDNDSTILQMDSVFPLPLSDYVRRVPTDLVCVNQPVIAVLALPKPQSTVVRVEQVVIAPEEIDVQLVKTLGLVTIANEEIRTPKSQRATQTQKVHFVATDGGLPEKRSAKRSSFLIGLPEQVPAHVAAPVISVEKEPETETRLLVEEAIIQDTPDGEAIVEATIVSPMGAKELRSNIVAITALVKMQKRIKHRYQKQKDDLINSLGL